MICLSFSSAIFADEYDDLMLSVSDKQPYEASFLLKQYQEKNPSFGNVYYQMGKIFNEMIPSVHPLYDFSEISLYMYNARLYFGNCLYYATADEMKKYAQYYSDVETNGKPLTYELFSSLLKQEIAKIIGTKHSDKVNKFETISYDDVVKELPNVIYLYLSLLKYKLVFSSLIQSPNMSIKPFLYITATRQLFPLI